MLPETPTLVNESHEQERAKPPRICQPARSNLSLSSLPGITHERLSRYQFETNSPLTEQRTSGETEACTKERTCSPMESRDAHNIFPRADVRTLHQTCIRCGVARESFAIEFFIVVGIEVYVLPMSGRSSFLRRFPFPFARQSFMEFLQ